MDDAATLTPSDGCELVITMDTVVAGVHYLEDETPKNIVAKLIGSNLSDLAAMGAKPVGFTLSCGWPKDINTEEIRYFADAINDWVDGFSFPLLGGDTVKTPGDAVFTLTAFGETPSGQSISRSGAQVGDQVFVSGTIGDGALGLLAAQGELTMLSPEDQAYLANRYRVPEPRISLGQSLIGHATSCIDISDGLTQDLGHIANASNVRIELELEAIPLSNAAKRAINFDPELMSLVLTGGDDYEIAFTGSSIPSNNDETVTLIGKITTGDPKVEIYNENGSLVEITKTGYNHFN